MDRLILEAMLRRVVKIIVREVVREELESMCIVGSEEDGGPWRLVHQSKIPNMLGTTKKKGG